MKNYLLVEKSKFAISPKEGAEGQDKYTLEGVFTEFDLENRNGRVYTKKEFLPHFEALKKVVESGTCVGELDHPKQFETTLKNVAHKIEAIWMDEANNRVMGRIKLLDTDAGKQAKALIDGGIPLHISSRAAGTVTENKTVKMHKLFTYDLVDTPGFANARLNSCNESFGMLNENSEFDDFSDFAIYEIEKQIQKDIAELNIKNKQDETMEYIKENEFNKYTDFTKEAIENVKKDIAEMKEIQESIIEQNDSIVDEYSNADFKSKLEAIDSKILGISKWADHVKEEFDAIKAPVLNELSLAKEGDIQVGCDYKGKGIVRSFEVQPDGSTKIFIETSEEPIFVEKTKVDNVIDNTTMQEKLSNMESKYSELEAKFEAMVKWSNHTTKTVTALEKWSDHSSETVSALESWSNHASESVTTLENWSEHVTESVTTLEKWSDHVTESVTTLEEGNVTKLKDTSVKINENNISNFKESIYSKLEGILEAKEQRATDKESLNESKNEKLIVENENPLWIKLMPAKYVETWKNLDESEQLRITKRAGLFEFKKESSIKDFWNNELTKENLIKEEKVQISNEENQAKLNERRAAAVKGFKQLFG